MELCTGEKIGRKVFFASHVESSCKECAQDKARANKLRPAAQAQFKIPDEFEAGVDLSPGWLDLMPRHLVQVSSTNITSSTTPRDWRTVVSPRVCRPVKLDIWSSSGLLNGTSSPSRYLVVAASFAFIMHCFTKTTKAIRGQGLPVESKNRSSVMVTAERSTLPSFEAIIVYAMVSSTDARPSPLPGA